MRSLVTKSFIAMAMIILISFLTLGISVYSQVYNYSTNEKKLALKNDAELIANMLENTNMSAVIYGAFGRLYQANITNLAKRSNSHIMITNEQGLVLVCSHDQLCPEVGRYVSENVMNKVLTVNEYSSIGTLDNYFEDAVYTIGLTVIHEEENEKSVIFLSLPVEGLLLLYNDIIKIFTITIIGVLLLSFVFAFFIIKRMTNPLKQMSLAAKSFSAGNFDIRIKTKGNDEIAELAESFNNMAVSLKQLENLRRDFIANVSHELKTPMTAISGFIDGIIDGTINAEKRDYYLTIINDEIKRLSRLVDKILYVSRLQSDSYHLSKMSFDICELIRRVVIGLEQKIDEKHIELEIDFEDDIILLQADFDAITQVVYNIINNAIKFSYNNSKMKVSAQTDDQNCIIKIYNEGKGIREEDIPFVFDRFYKADKSRGENRDGVGLGLYISKTIVNAHNGKIKVSSIEGKYAEFSIFLPNI